MSPLNFKGEFLSWDWKNFW